MKKRKFILPAVLCMIAAVTSAQKLDNTFNAGAIDCPKGNGTPGVRLITIQPDGKILIAGNFKTIEGGVTRNYIARLNNDGSIDNTFDPGAGPSWILSAMVLQPDKKIIIGGYFTSYNGTSQNYIGRINPDASIDATFNPGTGANSYLDDVALESDGKILIAGRFTSYNGTSRNYIARLNANGSLDTSFNPGTGADSYVYSVAVQPDGKILIGGGFSAYNGVSRNGMARLNTNGSLDNSLNAGLDTSIISKVLVQSDNKILAGGYVSLNANVSNCMRFNSDGSVDVAFVRGKNDVNSARPLAIQSDGKIFVGGAFSVYNATPRNGIARLNQDGSVDTTFNPGRGAENYNGVSSIVLQPDNKILIGGTFTSYDGTTVDKMARLTNNYSSNIIEERALEHSFISLYPIPTYGNIFVATGEEIAERIDVATILGQLVAIIKPSSPQTEISLASEPKGMYFVTVTSKGNRHSFKLVKAE